MSVPEDKYVELMRSILLAEPCRGVCTEPSRLLDHVYIGSQSNAESLRLLRQLGITHVLNCAGYKGPRPTPDASPYEGLGIDYYEFQAEDTDSYDICRHFPESFRYLDRAKRQGGTVLVHCALGINRSAAVCLGYMMTYSKMPLLQATKLLKNKRRIALANRAFQRQLFRFARSRGLLDQLEPENAQQQEKESASWNDGDRIAALLRSSKNDLLREGGSTRKPHRIIYLDSSSLRFLPPRYQLTPPRRTSNGPLSAVTSARSSGDEDAKWGDLRVNNHHINGVSTVDDLFKSGSLAVNDRGRSVTCDREIRGRRAQSTPRMVNGVRPASPMNDRRLGSESYSQARALEFRY